MTDKNLTDRELALLHTKFVVPMVAGQILRGDEVLDETSEYVLNTVIGDLQPESALLCIALCGQRMAAHCDHLPAAVMVRDQSDRIVEEYGSLWLETHDGGAKKTDLNCIGKPADTRLMAYIPEDLEAMAHLLDTLLADMDHRLSSAARLCDLLAVQAHDHMNYAEDMLEQQRSFRQKAFTFKEHHDAHFVPHFARAAMGLTSTRAASNVVPFPTRPAL